MAKIYLIAGEASGDFIGSQLIKSLRQLNHSSLTEGKIEFCGIGGRLMQEQGLASLFPISEINLMGFFEIIPHIFRLKKLIEQTAMDIIDKNPAILVTIDSPGFTYQVAKRVRKFNPELKMVHIVAPSVWAYKPERAIKYAKIYNHLLALLPFEPPYFEQVGLACSYIGHPVLEQEFSNKIVPSHPTICVTAGSRKGEISKHMPIFVEALNIIAEKYHNLQIIFVLADNNHQSLVSSYLTNGKFNFIFSTNGLVSFASSDAALAKSGTNTLEIAASGTPMIVAYKLNYFSYFLIKLLIKVKYASLINIIAAQEIIAEFIQFDCRAEKIATALINLLSNTEKAKQQVADSQKILQQLGFRTAKKPSLAAAEIILKLLQ